MRQGVQQQQQQNGDRFAPLAGDSDVRKDDLFFLDGVSIFFINCATVTYVSPFSLGSAGTNATGMVCLCVRSGILRESKKI